MEDTFQAAAVIQDTNGTEPEAEPEPELQQSFAAAVQQQDEDNSEYTPRLCQLCKWPDFDGFGFNLHAEKDKPGQYIGLVDPDSPAELGGLKEGDRIVEVNGENCEAQSHTVVIQRIKNGGEKTSMLVVDKATDDYFKRKGMTVCSSMTSVVIISTPPRLTETANRVTAITVASSQRVVASHPALPPPPPTGSDKPAQRTVPNGSAPNGINGGSAGDAAIISQTSSEPEPAVITSTTTTTSYSAPTPDAGDPILHLSAAEMKERLKSRKKQDPRHNKASFESKYKMFEKM